jgi:hypothetical protein
MENNYRLKVKVGDHEFDAEGPADIVQAQFAAFKEMLLVPTITTPTPAVPPARDDGADGGGPSVRAIDNIATDSAVGKIMKTAGRVVSLTVRPKSVEDAALLLLYGQKIIRDNDSVTGGDVIEGLTTTGGLAVVRVDRLLEKMARDGDAIVIGERRAKRYRLTNAGMTKARGLAADLIATVA